MFKLQSNFKPKGDQPQAIRQLSGRILAGQKHQTLLGVTGSGKTFTMAGVIEKIQRPTLVISPNKTLAAQLYQEFKEFFPQNAVRYFVSYYDYYQPEAYLPTTKTYIEKEVRINKELDRLRHAATQALLTRRDTIIVASISCIYNIGSPSEYQNLSLEIFEGQKIKRNEFIQYLKNLQYLPTNKYDAGSFKLCETGLEIYPASGENIIRVEFYNNKIIKIQKNNEEIEFPQIFRIFPAKYWVTNQSKLNLAFENIETELQLQTQEFKKLNKIEEAKRLIKKTHRDLELIKEQGYCHGIENYSRHLEFREPNSPPSTLLDYFHHAYQNNFLVFIDESHIAIPQFKGMYEGDRQRKEVLIEYGFRLPSALDNRPLKFDEINERLPQRIYVSATPAVYELKNSLVTEQLVRPTGLLDPEIEIRPIRNQLRNLIKEIRIRVARKQRVLVTVLTKRLAEDLCEYLKESGLSANYLHSEIKTLKRPEILRDLRLGKHDVIVGVNLLREGLDLPEVSLVAILDADKEGFLRNTTTLIQTMGRAARHIEGKIIMYADVITGSMKKAIEEINRRRQIQKLYNQREGVKPKTIEKPIRELITSPLDLSIDYAKI